MGHDGLRALGWVVSGPQSTPARIKQIAALFREELAAAGPDFDTESVDVGGERVYQLGEEIEHYTDVVPACIEGLRRVALGRATTVALRIEITDFLVGRWHAALAGEVDWGPLNIAALVDALKEIALFKRTREDQRTEIVKALCRRLRYDMNVDALGLILQAIDKPGSLATISSMIIRDQLDRRDDSGQFDDGDREVILRCLARLAGRKHLALSQPSFKSLREMVVDLLFDGLRDNVPGCYGRLVTLGDQSRMPRAIKTIIAKRLKTLTDGDGHE